jgi:hypothetical protein
MRLFLIDGHVYAVSIYKSTSQGGMEMDQMKEQENMYHGYMYCRDWRRWWYASRLRRIRIGILFILIGGLWMGSKIGFFNPAIFWPLAFITIGIWIIVSSLLRDKKCNLPK